MTWVEDMRWHDQCGLKPHVGGAHSHPLLTRPTIGRAGSESREEHMQRFILEIATDGNSGKS